MLLTAFIKMSSEALLLSPSRNDNHFFSGRVFKDWNRLSRGVVESSSQETLKNVWVWQLRTLFSGGHGGGAGLIVGLDDLIRVFQP